MMEGDHRVFDGDRALFAELAEGARNGFARGTCHGGHLLVRQKQRKAVAAVYMLADLVSEFEKEPSEPAGNCFGQGDATGVLQGEAVFLADALNGAHLCFAMITEEGEEPFAFYGTKLRGCERFGGNFVDTVGESRIEAQDRSGSGDANDHLAVLRAARGELEISGANQVEAAGILALAEEGGLGREADGAGDEFQVGQDRASKRAEPARPTIGACRTANGRLATDGLLPPRCGRGNCQVRHVRAFPYSVRVLRFCGCDGAHARIKS